jgi:hypothetical protein
MRKGFVTVTMKPAASAGPAAGASAKDSPETKKQLIAAAPPLVDEKKAIGEEEPLESTPPA